VQWRGRILKIRIERDDRLFDANLEAGEPMTLFVGGAPHELHPGHALRLP
jgi:hypothetical protein